MNALPDYDDLGDALREGRPLRPHEDTAISSRRAI